MATEFRLCEEDQEQFGGPGWVLFDRNALDDVRFDQLHEWESEMGIGTVFLLGGEFNGGKALGIKGVVWLARKLAGVETVPFKAFNIKTLKVLHRPAGADADPPAGGSSEPSSETRRSKKV